MAEKTPMTESTDMAESSADLRRRARVSLFREELFALGDWHIRQAEYHEQSIQEYDDDFAEQKVEWANAARRHRRRAELLYERARSVARA